MTMRSISSLITGRKTAFLRFTFLFFSFVLLGAKGFSQKITIHEQDVPLIKIFKSIEKQTGYSFFFDNAYVKQKRATVHINNGTIDEVLDKALKGLPLTYKILNKDIVITEKEEPRPAGKPGPSQQLAQLSGIVTDEAGVPLPSVNIRVKGSSDMITTTGDGVFTYDLPEGKKEVILVFSFVGFKNEEVKATPWAKITVKMAADVATLDQVQIIGYGTSSRRFNTGSTATINSSTLEKMPLNDPVLALQGRMPGVQVTPTSGLPGSEVKVQVRGINSLNRNPNSAGIVDASNSPMYIVDGVPFVSTPLNAQGVGANMGVYNATAGTVTFSSPFKSINPSDIENITVLKDADATAIYGARGANGVILITTKRAKAGRTMLDIDSYTGAGKVPKFINMLNTPQYLAMREEAFKNDGGTPTDDPNDFFGYAPDMTVWDKNAYTNWQKKYAGATASNTSVQATLSGGNEQTRFLFSAGYRKQGTAFPGNYGLDQGSFRLNVDHNSLDRRFRMNISVMYTTDLNKLLDADPYSYFTLPPNMPLYNADGSFFFYSGTNPEAAYQLTYQDRAKNLNGNVQMSYLLAKNLDFKISMGYNRIQQDQEKQSPSSAFAPGSGARASRDQSANVSNTSIIEPQLNYTAEIGNGNLIATLGGTYQETKLSSLFLRGMGYTNDDLLGDLGSAATVLASISQSDYKYLSAFFRLGYNVKKRYLLNLTGRRDGSSRFGTSRRFGNFGAVGAGWIFTEESFMRRMNWLSFGKLRASYGVTGNDKIGDYQYYNTYQANSSAPYQTIGYIPNRLFNANYQWETNRKLEAAIELGFFKDRIFISADYYRNRTGNSLVSYPLPSQTGFQSVTQNLDAKIQNSGVEFSLSTVNIKQANFTWNTSFNLSFQRNKLLSFPGLESSLYSTQYAIGQSISNIHGFVYGGVDPQTGAAIIQDLNKNGVLYEYPSGTNQGDQTIIANSLPSYYGGITNSFSYGNWQLDLFFNYRKLDKMPYAANQLPGSGFNIDNTTGARWQKPGDVTNTPRYAALFVNPTTFELNDAYLNYFYLSSSDYTLRSGSYLRLSNASLSYTLPKRWLQGIALKAVRVYIIAQNLFTITKYPGPDPETGLSMPQSRILTAGAKISL